MPGSGKRSPGVGERGRRGAGVTRVSLMGWKLCGDKKERGLVLPRDRSVAEGDDRGKEGVRREEYQHILLRTNIQPKWE